MKTKEEELNEFLEKDLSFISGDAPEIDYDISSNLTTDKKQQMVTRPATSYDYSVGYYIREEEEVVNEFMVSKKSDTDSVTKMDNELIKNIELPDLYQISNKDVVSYVYKLIKILNSKDNTDERSVNDKLAVLSTMIDKINLTGIDYDLRKSLLKKLHEKL